MSSRARLIRLTSLLLLLTLPGLASAGPRRPGRGRPKPAPAKKIELEPELRQRVQETLVEALASRDALAQGRALAALVDLDDATAAARVDEALAEENWAIRSYALLIAGREDRKTFPPAMLLSLENTRTRPHAFALVELLPLPIRLKVFRGALQSPEESLRNEVIQRMLDAGDEDAIGVLASLLDSKDAKLREAGLQTLPKMGSPAGIAYLMKLTRSKDKELRPRAQAALLQSKDPRVKPFLLEQLHKSKELRVRVEAARALATKGTRDEVLPVLKKALDERDVDIRVIAMEGIAALGDRVVAAELRPLAVNHREDRRISTAALRVLGGTGDLANLEVLRRALSLDYLHLRVAAVQAMGDLRRREAAGDLAGALQDGSAEVRQAAAVALGMVGGPEAVPPLQAAVDRETEPEVRARIIEALGRTGEADGLMALQVLLVSPEESVRLAAVEAILEIGDPKTANTLLVVVDPRYPKVMEAAIRAMCLLDPNLGMMALRPHLRRVSLDVVHTLHREAGPRGQAFLETFLGEGTREQRGVALELLLRRGAGGLAAVRKAAGGNDDAAIRRAALRALMAREDKGALPIFAAGLKDPDDAIRGICAEALGRLGVRADHEPLLLPVLEDRAASVRAATAHAIVRLATQ